MQTLKAGSCIKRGFTLIEVVVVMAILSIAFVSFMPKMTSFFTEKEQDPAIKLLNSLTQKAFEEAREGHCPAVIWGTKGSNHIYYANKQYTLPEDVFDVKVDGGYQEGLRYYFLIYPDGMMDEVKVRFENDKTIQSLPLLLRWQ